MNWNYRVVHRVYRQGTDLEEHSYSIHEAYYDENGKVTTITVEPVPCWADSMDGLNWTYEKFKIALEKPVLEWDQIPESGATSFKDAEDADEEPFGITHEGE